MSVLFGSNANRLLAHFAHFARLFAHLAPVNGLTFHLAVLTFPKHTLFHIEPAFRLSELWGHVP